MIEKDIIDEIIFRTDHPRNRLMLELMARGGLWRNIDIGSTLSQGPTEQVEDEVKQRIKDLAPGGGFILGSSNSIIDGCKPENVRG